MKQINQIPRHIAIIMDGNRRWAKERHKPAILGHRKGAERLEEALVAAISFGVEALTVYGFSTENRKRSDIEVRGLMELIEYTLRQKRALMIKNEVKFCVIGDREQFSADLLTLIEEIEKETENNKKITFVVALNYGSRDEIKRTFHKLLINYKDQWSQISEDTIESYLDTSNLPPIDMLIRTSGEKRVSNFLLWQIAYAELFFEETLWPDFDKQIFLELVNQYAERHRRIGT